jgi:hypothetical protein
VGQNTNIRTKLWQWMGKEMSHRADRSATKGSVWQTKDQSKESCDVTLCTLVVIWQYFRENFHLQGGRVIQQKRQSTSTIAYWTYYLTLKMEAVKSSRIQDHILETVFLSHHCNNLQSHMSKIKRIWENCMWGLPWRIVNVNVRKWTKFIYRQVKLRS